MAKIVDSLLVTLRGRYRIPGRSKIEVSCELINIENQRWNILGDTNYSPISVKPHERTLMGFDDQNTV